MLHDPRSPSMIWRREWNSSRKIQPPLMTTPESNKTNTEISKTLNQNTSQNTESTMEKINSTILKTALEAIPKLTADNYTLWKNLVDNMLDIQNLREALTSENGTLTDTQDVQLRTIITSKIVSLLLW
ncbi:hypothetical protein PGT21_014659 [Puccinia graminis f. sp. tritici]|nr:hypothetical protein PGT21_014659 [Puccinia graminis f. sp. tritici]KAA1138546.1 hypothetical protein PGTUg99_028062 [Puccinia graminis f. sp. tritici]